MLLTDSPPEVRGTVQNFTSDGHDLKTMSMEGGGVWETLLGWRVTRPSIPSDFKDPCQDFTKVAFFHTSTH